MHAAAGLERGKEGGKEDLWMVLARGRERGRRSWCWIQYWRVAIEPARLNRTPVSKDKGLVLARSRCLCSIKSACSRLPRSVSFLGWIKQCGPGTEQINGQKKKEKKRQAAATVGATIAWYCIAEHLDVRV